MLYKTDKEDFIKLLLQSYPIKKVVDLERKDGVTPESYSLSRFK